MSYVSWWNNSLIQIIYKTYYCAVAFLLHYIQNYSGGLSQFSSVNAWANKSLAKPQLFLNISYVKTTRI